MLLAAIIVELFSRKRTLAAGLLITGICTAALMASPAQVSTVLHGHTISIYGISPPGYRNTAQHPGWQSLQLLRAIACRLVS